MFSAVDAAKMSDREALNLIFMPSFSTAEKITNISGRGVGMDVVQTHIEKISCTIDLQSQVGKGTTFKLKIPLTLAIIPTLIITTEVSRYAIPQVNLLELMRLEGEQIKKNRNVSRNSSISVARATAVADLFEPRIAVRNRNCRKLQKISIRHR